MVFSAKAILGMDRHPSTIQQGSGDHTTLFKNTLSRLNAFARQRSETQATSVKELLRHEFRTGQEIGLYILLLITHYVHFMTQLIYTVYMYVYYSGVVDPSSARPGPRGPDGQGLRGA